MVRLMIFFVALTVFLFCVSPAVAGSVSMKLSGPGAVNDSTIKAGEKVSVDIYISNDKPYTMLSLGFKITSPDLAAVTHVADSGNGRNPRGDVKGHNGFDNLSVFDLGGLHVVEVDWDGKLPELIGFGGAATRKDYEPHELAKKISMEMVFDTPGTVVIDSSYFPPLGDWEFSLPIHKPQWGGPYTVKVLK